MDPGQYQGAWDRSRLPSNVRVGPGCYLENIAVFDRFRSELDPGLVLGADVQVYTWSAFSVEAGGYLEIGDRSVIVGAIFMCAGSIVVGHDVLISHQVTVADSDFHPLDVVQRRHDAVALAPGGDRASRTPFVSRPVVIGDGAWIGIGALILKGVSVGSGARIGPGAVVTRSIPAGTSWAGNPARPVDRLDDA